MEPKRCKAGHLIAGSNALPSSVRSRYGRGYWYLKCRACHREQVRKQTKKYRATEAYKRAQSKYRKSEKARAARRARYRVRATERGVIARQLGFWNRQGRRQTPRFCRHGHWVDKSNAKEWVHPATGRIYWACRICSSADRRKSFAKYKQTEKYKHYYETHVKPYHREREMRLRRARGIPPRRFNVPPEQRRKEQLANAKRNRETLAAPYIRALIRGKEKRIGKRQVGEFSPELIELKRQQMRLVRSIKSHENKSSSFGKVRRKWGSGP